MTNYATTPEGVSILFGRLLVILLGALPADFVLSEGGEQVVIISALLAGAVHLVSSFACRLCASIFSAISEAFSVGVISSLKSNSCNPSHSSSQ